nr:MAG TPA: hypothetical protein [Caudoviricetes sp.]
MYIIIYKYIGSRAEYTRSHNKLRLKAQKCVVR